MKKVYLCIDFKKPFFASCECSERHLDPFKTNLVVADPTRGNGALCLAITPQMKSMGIHNRCRIFEIPRVLNILLRCPVCIFIWSIQPVFIVSIVVMSHLMIFMFTLLMNVLLISHLICIFIIRVRRSLRRC